MIHNGISKWLILSVLLLIVFIIHSHCEEKEMYIVYMGEKHQDQNAANSLHYSMLQSVSGSLDTAKASMVYSYGRSFNGFVAMLSREEAAKFSDMEGVVSVFLNTETQLQTTRSWDFVGLTEYHLRKHPKHSFHGDDIIIGILDSGIWPDSESFDDEGLGPPPKKWKGKCQASNNFNCNNKVIGARYYNAGGLSLESYNSSLDITGHGTHTASIAAGREVVGASHRGLAKGLVRGGAPNARIAVYKVCQSFGCYASDILAAFDDAIADGVDIISISTGGYANAEYFEDPTAIESFHAMRKGILTVGAGGYQGPIRAYLSNLSPWLLTVAASSIDRKLITPLVLGNGDVIPGYAINTYNLKKLYPLIWGGQAANFSANYNSKESSECYPNSLDSKKTNGKIVLCQMSSNGHSILMAGGAGIISPRYLYENFAIPYPIPQTRLEEEDITRVLDYIKSTKNPRATILFSETRMDNQAPYAANFSSRGPNVVNPDILKPDLSAPGVDILAAWSPFAPLSSEMSDTRSAKYNIVSGTSVACAHVTGAAAYVKAAHPSWSPAAIKSALMTTANVMDTKKHEDENEFAYGSGLLNPVKALDPGLIFNASDAVYIDFLCKQGYDSTLLRKITNDNTVCLVHKIKRNPKLGRVSDLNYPSFSLPVIDGQKIKGYFPRTVTNVGSPNSTYNAVIDMPSFLKVTIDPSILAFSEIGEEKSFTESQWTKNFSGANHIRFYYLERWSA